MRTIVVTNQKGGCGKTTTSVNLAAALVQKGLRVLIVDLDPQAHATLGLGYEPDALGKTIYNSLANKQLPISKIIIGTNIKGLDLAPSNVLLAKAELELTHIEKKEYILAEQLKTVSSRYDICVIDCPPSLGLLTFNALVASTDVIVPVQVHYYALEGLKQLLETVKTARKRFYPCSVKILGLLLTFVERKAALSQQVEQQMRQFFGNLVFDTVIHRTISLAEAPSAGQSISTYAPESTGTADYMALAEEVTDPEYRKKRKLPREVSAIVDEVQAAEKADVLQPSVGASGRKKRRAAVPGPRKAIKNSLVFLLVSTILLLMVVVTLMFVMNMTNKPPVAPPESVTILEDVPTPITLKASDPDGDQLTYHLLTGPSHGTLNGTGPAMTYTPEPNYNGPDRFSYTVSDGTADSNTAIVSITVRAVDDPPVARNQSATIKSGRSAPIVLTGTDIDSQTLKFAISMQPENGTLNFGSDFEIKGKLVYTPLPNFTGTDSFTFSLDDGSTISEPAIVSINVTPNHTPVAELLSVTVTEDTSSEITLAGSDPDGDTLVYSVVKGPSHGTLGGTPPNLTYTPNGNFNGPDAFAFRVSDGTADSALGTVSVTVSPVNDPPIASNDNIAMLEDMPASVILRGGDPDGNAITYAVLTTPEHGTLSGTEPNLVYTPNENFSGSDRFTFKVNDGDADSLPATISFAVTPIDDPPTANGDSVTVQEDMPSSIIVKGIDPDGDKLTYEIVKKPTHGKLDGTPPNLTYTPDPNFSWLDSFTFRVSDGKAESVPATILIRVAPANDPPKAVGDVATTAEDTPATIDVLANDIDVDNELLKIVAVTQGKSGSVVINPNGTVTYTPNADFSGDDTFTYTLGDSEDKTDSATVKVAVGTANDTPKITSKPVTTAMVDVAYTYEVKAVDPDKGDVVTYSLTTNPAGMTINPVTGLIQWTPTDSQKTSHEVGIMVVDSNSVPASDTQQFSINVNPTPPKTATLKVVGGYDQISRKPLSADNRTDAIRESDNKRFEANSGSSVSYDFSKVSVPKGATITSVVVFVEHFEEQQFSTGKLQWEIGAGWPAKPDVWVSIDAPVRRGEQNEATDCWDITSFVNTPEKVGSLQLKINNKDNIARKKALVDCIYAVVEWDWPAAPKRVAQQGELQLIRE
ncbi:MAG: Ig-like domain-containing protein [Planctomycetota bacterium]